MIGSEVEGQSRDQMRTKNGELGWLNREAHKQKRAGAFSNSSLLDGSADCEVLASRTGTSLANSEYQIQSSLMGPYTSAAPKGTYSKPRLSGSS